MTKHFEREMDRLKKDILSVCALSEEAVFKAVKAVTERDAELAEIVLNADEEIDRREVEIEEDCLKILALHQPVAIDLRFVIAVLKINNDIERIGDLAGNIASRAKRLSKVSEVAIPIDLKGMAERAKSMLRKSIDSLVKMDLALAREVCAEDDEVDKLQRQMYALIQNKISDDVDGAESYIYLLSVSKNIERIADLATNIAEDVIYMIDGEIVRHRL